MTDGYLSLLCSVSDKPLEYWSKKQSHTGCIRKILDSDLFENVVEIQDFEGSNAPNTSISCPPDVHQRLDVKLPLLVIVIKNVKADCSFKVQVTDDKKICHYFKFSNSESEKQIKNRNPRFRSVKLELEPEWNRLELDLRHFTRTAFGCDYSSTQRLEICANCRLRRVYFIDRSYGETEISAELCHKFFDTYMLKWGAYLVENTTQTVPEETKSPKIRASDIDTALDTVKSNNVHEEFLKNIFIKSNILLNGFINKKRSDVQYIHKTFQEIPVKHYVIPQSNSYGKLNDTKDDKKDKIKDKSYLTTPRLFDTNHFQNKQGIYSPRILETIGRHKREEISMDKWTCRYFNNTEKLLASPTLEKENGLVKKFANTVHDIDKKIKTDKNEESEESKNDNDRKDFNFIRNQIRPVSSPERRFVRRNSHGKRFELQTLRYPSANTGLNTKYFVDGFNGRDLSSPFIKRDNFQDTIFDLKRTYMNLINDDTVVESANNYSLVIS